MITKSVVVFQSKRSWQARHKRKWYGMVRVWKVLQDDCLILSKVEKKYCQVPGKMRGTYYNSLLFERSNVKGEGEATAVIYQ